MDSPCVDMAEGFGACQPSSDGNASPPEPIAVVGMSLRFPGEATSVESFWRMLCEERSAMTEFPPERFNIDAFYNQQGGQGTVWHTLSSFDAYIWTIAIKDLD